MCAGAPFWRVGSIEMGSMQMGSMQMGSTQRYIPACDMQRLWSWASCGSPAILPSMQEAAEYFLASAARRDDVT